MSIIGEHVLLRAYLLTTDQTHIAPTYERLVQRAGRARLAGATVIRGIYGFGSRGIHASSAWHLVDPAPVIVEIVDSAERIAGFANNELGSILKHGLVTLERAAVMMYRHRAAAEPKLPMKLPGIIKDLSTVPGLEGSANMKSNEDGVLLRVFAGDSDEVAGKPLYEAVVQKARELGLSGATVLRGSMGFGANSVLHTAKVVDLSTDLPIVIEIVDSQENIQRLLPHLDAMVKEGMITMESVRIIAYRHNPQDAT